MKKHYLTFLLSIMAGAIIAAEIKYEYNETDKFTGSTKYLTTPVEIINKVEPADNITFRDFSLSVLYAEKQNYLRIDYKWKFGTIPQLFYGGVNGTHMIVLLENGQQLKLYSAPKATEVKPTGGVTQKVTHYFIVTNDDAKKLSDNLATDFRIVGMHEISDIEIPDAKRVLVKEICGYFHTEEPATSTTDNIQNQQSEAKQAI